jgi:hypothetical protein
MARVSALASLLLVTFLLLLTFLPVLAYLLLFASSAVLVVSLRCPSVRSLGF